jgi:hypothetical protein
MSHMMAFAVRYVFVVQNSGFVWQTCGAEEQWACESSEGNWPAGIRPIA